MAPWGTLIFSYYIYVGLAHLGGVQILNFSIYIYIYIYIFFFFLGGGGVRKMNILGYENNMDIFGGHLKTRLVLGVISMHFRVFS